ncbi:MAG TPA: acyl-CoA dehydrogenase family protein [Dehalococcoidales bacterium]|nr:acyl-CoA dehydrogenase family protein [Dehalococcoidales bacterium]
MDFELSEELKMVQRLARDFVDEQLKPLERDILGRSADLSDARAYLPPEKEDNLVKMVKDMGLWGIGVPEDLGGAGLSALGVCVVEEELGRTVTPFRFGDISPVLFECTPEQREKFLKPALDNQKRPYMALLEKDSADPKKMQAGAEKQGGDYIINGEKISLSRPGADYFAIVFALAEAGPTAFLVDKDTPGFTVEDAAQEKGWLARLRQPLTLIFKNTRISASDRLGEEGKAFKLGEKWLPQRRIVRGARSVGAARRLLDEAATQATSLETFGKPIFKRTNIQAALADISIHIHAARLMVYEAACAFDLGKPVKRASVMVKLYTTQMLHTVADRVAHIFNGPPYMEGLPLERLCRRALEDSAIEFALERQRSIVATDAVKGLK